MGLWQSHDLDAAQRLAGGALSLYPGEPSDESLLQALAHGAVWAMEAFYRRYSSLLYSMAYRMVDDHQVAEEVVQDAFFAVWQHATSYSPQVGSVRVWLISLLRHRSIDYLRGVRRRSCWKEIPWEAVEGEEDVALPDVWEETWDSLLRVQVREALLHLPSEQRLVITLAYFRGWTHTEIAQRYQLPLGTVKARMRLGLLHLKQELEQGGIDEKSSSSNPNRGQVKPKQAATVVVQVVQSGCAAGYELYRDGSCRCFGYTEWEPLLEQIEAFEFNGPAGGFTARKERRAHGRAYWYALTWGSSGRRKTYLGRSTELTLARLEAIASKLYGGSGAANI